MNSQHFNEELEKLKLRKPRTVEVLRMVLARRPDAEIAKFLGIHQGTVRKHIEKLYAAFGIKSEFEGDRRSKRGDLVARFAKYKPEWVNDCPSGATNEVSDQREQVNQNSVTLSTSPTTKASEGGEDLMSLATTMLENLGFNKYFKLSRSSPYIGYRLKNPEEGTNLYQLVLAPQKDVLCVYIPQNILELDDLLQIYYWLDIDEYSLMNAHRITILWIIPSKRELFLNSLHPYYWYLIEDKVCGRFNFNMKDELIPQPVSDENSYVIVEEDQHYFPYTWKVCINSKEILQEFINCFGIILIEQYLYNFDQKLNDIDF